MIFENTAVTLLLFLIIPPFAPEARRLGSFKRRLGHCHIKSPLKQRCLQPPNPSSLKSREYLHRETQVTHTASAPIKFVHLPPLLVVSRMSDSLQTSVDTIEVNVERLPLLAYEIYGVLELLGASRFRCHRGRRASKNFLPNLSSFPCSTSQGHRTSQDQSDYHYSVGLGTSVGELVRISFETSLG